MAEMLHELEVGTTDMIEGKEERITYARVKDVTDVVQQHVQLLSDHKLLVHQMHYYCKHNLIKVGILYQIMY